MEDNWFPAFSVPECVPDGCVYMRWAAYEFRIMMDGWVKSKEHETVYATTPYISIHLLLMQQPQRWGSGTLCWRPNESWVIYHVESQSSSPASSPYTTPSWFFLFAFISSSSFLYLYPSLLFTLLSSFPFFSIFIFIFLSFFLSFPLFFFITFCLLRTDKKADWEMPEDVISQIHI